MRQLPQTKIDRIEQEAEAFSQQQRTIEHAQGADAGYIEGATTEATRALPLYEALKFAKQLLDAYDIRYENTSQLLVGYTNEEGFAKINAALASYDTGEAPEPGKEAKLTRERFIQLGGVNQGGWIGVFVQQVIYDEEVDIVFELMDSTLTVFVNDQRLRVIDEPTVEQYLEIFRAITGQQSKNQQNNP